MVAADIPGAREQFKECVLYADPANPEEIAAACMRIIGELALRASLIGAGKARAAAWTGEDFVRGVFGILDDFAPIRRTWR